MAEGTIEGEPRPAASRRRVFQALLFLTALGLLGLAIWTNRGEIAGVLRRPIDPAPFGLAFAAYLTSLMLTFQRWFMLVRAVGLPFSLRDAVRLGFIGNVFNLVIPGAVGGDVIKGAFFCREQGKGKNTRAIASIVIDRVLGLMGLFLLGTISGIFAYREASPGVRNLIFAVAGLFAAGVAFLAVIFTPALYRPLNRLVSSRPRLVGVLGELERMAGAYRGSLPTVLLGLLSALTTHALNVLAFYLISRALFWDDPALPSFVQHYVITPLVLLSTAVPLPMGALGLVENVSDLLFNLVNYKGGAVTMMGFRLVMYAGGLVSLAVYLANLRQVRQLERLGGGA